ncbi:MAG: sigma-70 family RNA polymerase sigma factor [Myxococcota bacterium]
MAEARGKKMLRARIATGDLDAFVEWMREAEPRLRASVRRFASQVDVEAVVQEILLRVWQLAPNLEGRHGVSEPLLAVSLRIARNLAIDEARRAKLGPVPVSELPEAGVEPSLPDPWLPGHVEACREKLPPKPRLAFDLRLRAAGVQHDADLAQEIGMQVHTFLKNLRRARKLLLACLEKVGAGELR